MHYDLKTSLINKPVVKIGYFGDTESVQKVN